MLSLTIGFGYRTYRNPKLKPASVSPRLRILSLDIETRANTDRIYSIGADVRDYSDRGWQQNERIVFMINSELDDTDEPIERPLGYQLHYVKSEKSLLLSFVEWLKAVDPDVLVGWAVVGFDLNFLQRVHQRLNIPFDYGRGSELAHSRARGLRRNRSAQGGLLGV